MSAHCDHPARDMGLSGALGTHGAGCVMRHISYLSQTSVRSPQTHVWRLEPHGAVLGGVVPMMVLMSS